MPCMVLTEAFSQIKLTINFLLLAKKMRLSDNPTVLIGSIAFFSVAVYKQDGKCIFRLTEYNTTSSKTYMTVLLYLHYVISAIFFKDLIPSCKQWDWAQLYLPLGQKNSWVLISQILHIRMVYHNKLKGIVFSPCQRSLVQKSFSYLHQRNTDIPNALWKS